MVKKFLLCICLCCLFAVCVCAKTRYDGKYVGDVFTTQQSDEEKYILKQKAKEKKFYMDKLKKAKKFYVDGVFDKAEAYINEVLLVEPDNEKANELKNKILLLKEKESFYKKMLVEDYYIELRRAIKDSNYYEGTLYIKKIKNLIPEESLDSFNKELTEEQELILSAFENEKDKKIFLDSIDAFLNEQYRKYSKLVYKLYDKYPMFGDFIGMSRYYIIREESNKRINVLYDRAIKYFRAGKLGKAKSYAEMAYNLQQENINLKLLIDRIDMEII